MDADEMVEAIRALQEGLQVAMADMRDLITEMAIVKPVENSEVYQFIVNLQAAGMGHMALDYIQRRYKVNLASAESYLFDFVDTYSNTNQMVYTMKSTIQNVTEEPPPPGTEEPVRTPKKRVLKVKKATAPGSPTKPRGLLVWNSFLQMTKSEMEAAGEPTTYSTVLKRAVDTKNADLESYKLFAENWTP